MELLSKYHDINEELKAVEKNILSNVHSRQAVINNSVGELLNSGGKRIRPLFLLLSAMLGDYKQKKIVPLASCVEILHMATLIHDDIIDDAVLRRGSETLQSKWGKDIAVFIGDYLFSRLFLIADDLVDEKAMQKINQTIKTICEGEIYQYSHRYNKNISILKYLRIIASKTAVLFKTSCYLGASGANSSYDIQRVVQGYGFNFGMAFQIIDDIYDYTAKPKEIGKPVNNDLAHGIYTLPLIYALSKKKYKSQLITLLDNDDNYGIAEISYLVHKAGGIDYSRSIAKEYINRADMNLRTLPKSPSRKIMGEILLELREKV